MTPGILARSRENTGAVVSGTADEEFCVGLSNPTLSRWGRFCFSIRQFIACLGYVR